MFQQGTEVGCCAIMHEERKRGSKAASSKGNKQRQTGVCLPEAPLNLSGRGTNRHPHTPTSITHSRSNWWPGCYADKTHTHTLSIVCVRFCARVLVSVPRCRPDSSWSKPSPCQRPLDTKRQAESRVKRWGGWSGEERTGGEWRHRIIHLLTAISGGQQQSEPRSLSASGGAIVFTSHHCRRLPPPPPPLCLLLWDSPRCPISPQSKSIWVVCRV